MLQADELAVRRQDLHQLALAVEVQLAPVGPAPGVFLAAPGLADADRAISRIGAGAQAGVARIAVEDDAAAVGLHDLHGAAQYVQVGLVRQLPAAPDQVGRRTGLAVRAVVVADDLQAQGAGQRRHVDFALVLVTVDDVDRVARADVHAGAAAHCRGPRATAGCAAVARAAGAGRRYGRKAGDAAGVGRAGRRAWNTNGRQLGNRAAAHGAEPGEDAGQCCGTEPGCGHATRLLSFR